MKSFLQRLLSFVLLISPLSLSAAESQYWTSMQITSGINDQFSLYGELINRYSDEKNEFTTRSNRLGLVYKINSDLTYTIMIENRDTDSDANDEIRFINQLQKKFNFDVVSLAARLRLENREFSNTPVFALRGRILLRADFDQYELYHLKPFVSYEYFNILNDTIGRPSGSTEHRNQIGFTTSVKAINAKAEISYLARTTERPAWQTLDKLTNTYSILNLVLKWDF